MRRPCSRRPGPSRPLAGVLALMALMLALAGPAFADAGPQTWSARLADAVGTAALASGGSGVTVAVLDTWIDGTHPDFGGRVLPGADCATGHVCRAGTIRKDGCEPHGTHVAGIIAGAAYGVAPRSSVLPVRVLADGSGGCTADSQDVARGVRWAAAHGAQVINLSLGSTYPVDDPGGVLRAEVAAVSRAGVIVVVAAGNGQASATDVYGQDALVIAALGPSGRLASYSQRGTGVDLAAPGGDPVGGSCDPAHCVVSTWSDHGYAADAGTSMAAPYVAGAAALLIAQRPARGRADVERALISTAVPLAGAGAGRLDIRRALALEMPSASTQEPASNGQPVAPAQVTRLPATVTSPTPAGQTAAPVHRSGDTGATKLLLIMLAATLIGVTGSAVWQAGLRRSAPPS